MIASEPRITNRVVGERTSRREVLGTMNRVERVYIPRPSMLREEKRLAPYGIGQVGQGRTRGGSYLLRVRACDTGFVHP